MSEKKSSLIDRIKHLQKFDSVETSSVTCISDPDFVSGLQVSDFFNGLLENKQGGLFTFGWILLTLGIKPKQLVKLVRSTNDKQRHRHPIHLNITTGILSYRLVRKGKDKRSTKMDRIQTLLPNFVLHFLTRAESCQPFKKIHGRFDRQARKYRKAKGGITPTARRLSKTFHLLISPHMPDKLSANTITGTISSEYKAQAYYHLLHNGELNNDWQPAHQHLAGTLLEEPTTESSLQHFLSKSAFRGTAPDYPLGSQRVTNDEALEKFFDDIYQVATSAHQDIRHTHKLDQVKAFLRYMNLECAHLFQMQRYAYSLRTVADRTEIYTTPAMHFAVIVDKDSRDFLEMRLVPRNAIEMKQQQVNQQDLSLLLALSEELGIKVHYDNNLYAHNYAVHLKLNHNTKTGKHCLSVQRLTQKRFNKLMQSEGINNPSVDNAGRHDLASRCRYHIPELFLDQNLNHNRAAHNGYAPHSSASISRHDLQQVSATIHDLFPFRLLKLRRAISKTCLSNDRWKALKEKPLVLPHIKPGKIHSDKKARFSVLPDDPREFPYYPDVVDAYHFLWQQGFAKEKNSDSLRLIGFALTCCFELGFGDPYLTETLMRMQWQDLTPYLRLRIPLQRNNEDTPYYTAPITKSAMNLLIGYFLDHQPSLNDYIFLPEVRTFNHRKKAIEDALSNQWHQLKESFITAHPDQVLPTIDVALRLGRLHAINEVGIEPYFSTLHTDWAPPTSHAARYHDPLLLEELTDPTRYTKMRHQPNTSFRKRAAPIRLKIAYKKSHTLPQKMKKVLQSLTNKLDSIATERSGGKSNKLKYPDVANIVHEHIDNLLEEADELCPSGNSALHLALEWVRYRFQPGLFKKHLAASTISKYLGVFRNRLFAIPETTDLTWLEPNTLVDYLKKWIVETDNRDTTSTQINNRFYETLSFGCHLGYFPDLVEIPFLKGKAASLGTRRADLISPDHIDTIIESLFDTGDRESQEQAAMLILAHYCGLRESETRALALDDVVTASGHCFIYIRMGKSYRARRGVPLHLVGHPRHCKILKTVYENRRAEFEAFGDDLKHTFYLGPIGARRGYSRWEITTPVIEMLKFHFGPDADLHLLRHSFGSWLAVRLTALRYPQIVDELTYRGHWMFEARHQRVLINFFSLNTGSLLSFESNSLLRIARLIGHASARTLFTYYVQTLNVIQKEVTLRADEIFSSRVISYETAKKLFKGLRSSGDFRTLSNQHHKTVGDIFDYLLPRYLKKRSKYV